MSIDDVSDVSPRVQYVASPSQTDFDYPFPIFEVDDLVVNVNGNDVALDTDYTVTGVALETGGTVVFVVGRTNGDVVTIYRATAIERSSDFQQNGPWSSATLNTDFNKLIIICQELAAKLGRSLRFSQVDDVTSSSLELSIDQVAQKYLRFDANGNPDLVDGIAQLGQVTLPVPVENGGTGADTGEEALQNLGIISLSDETTVTSATSLDADALGKAFLIADSGSPASYQVDLPSGSPVGSLIFLRIASSATKLYTINGVDVGIDGTPHRVLWRGESCLLKREASNWTKVGGRTIPFRGDLQRSASLNMSAGAGWNVCLMTDETGDQYSLDLCLDTVNGRFKAPRAGSFHFDAYTSIIATVTTSAAFADIALEVADSGSPTSTPCTLVRALFQTTDARQILHVSGTTACAENDFVRLLGRIQDAGGGASIATPKFEFSTGSIVPSLSYHEVPLW